MKDIIKFVLSGVLGGLVVVLGLSAFPQALSLGAQSNFSGPINSTNGYQVAGVQVIDADQTIGTTVNGVINTTS